MATNENKTATPEIPWMTIAIIAAVVFTAWYFTKKGVPAPDAGGTGA